MMLGDFEFHQCVVFLTHAHARLRIASLSRPHATFYLPRNVCAALQDRSAIYHHLNITWLKTNLTSSSVGCRPQQGVEPASVPARHTGTVRFEILDDEVDISNLYKRNRDFPERKTMRIQ
ncbi:uncharacterized protein LOC110835930 [Zootermopsis nevadensis]|uniref:uncharacterized protein LOC110835930 n=1 Tax=Zootermopsis nevadensis TaxID=136037 RepID=UPI000B8EB990|nr:uncharacterized protein LOC110835930 [Zootermopsis nevadensis]